MASPIYRIAHKPRTASWLYTDMDELEYEATPCRACNGTGCEDAGEYCEEEEGMFSNQWFENHRYCSACEGDGYHGRLLS